jgi:DNA-binding IclR family transcriptional regulator
MQHPHSDLSTVETADVAHVEREPKRRQRKQVVPIQAIPPARKVKNAVKPVANAIRPLKFLAQTGKPTTVTQIAREFAINTSTCFNILRTLVGEDMIDFSELSKTYTVGLGTVKLVEKTLSDGERMAAAMPHLAEIADHFAVNVTVWKRMAMERIILVATQETSRYPRIHMKPGQRLPLLMGASGRLIAANLKMSKAEVKSAFKNLRWKGRPASFETYWREVQIAAKRGWASDDGYFSAGIVTVAAPILDPNGVVAFTISALTFRGQHDDKEIIRLGEQLKVFGQRLTSILF